MSPSTSRFILSGAVIGLTRVTYSIGKHMTLELGPFDVFPKTSLPDYESLQYLEAAVLACMVLAIGWLVVWWGQVRWTAMRIILTAASLIWATIPAVGAAIFFDQHYWPESRVYIAAICWASCWIGSTALIWRSPEERHTIHLSRTVPCPQCGFDLQGRRDTQCPECGRKYCLGDFASASRSAA